MPVYYYQIHYVGWESNVNITIRRIFLAMQYSFLTHFSPITTKFIINSGILCQEHPKEVKNIYKCLDFVSFISIQRRFREHYSERTLLAFSYYIIQRFKLHNGNYISYVVILLIDIRTYDISCYNIKLYHYIRRIIWVLHEGI